MTTPMLMFSRNLTGRARFRESWMGNLVLQVELIRDKDAAVQERPEVWRDARQSDLARLRKLRAQMGLDALL